MTTKQMLKRKLMENMKLLFSFDYKLHCTNNPQEKCLLKKKKLKSFFLINLFGLLFKSSILSEWFI